VAKDAIAKLAADVVALAEHEGELQVLLIERGWPPFEGCLALPGGHLEEEEDFEDAAHRELLEETGVAAVHLEKVDVYGKPGRDPRGRYVTVAFVALLDDMPAPTAGDDARAAQWFPVAKVLAGAATRGVRPCADPHRRCGASPPACVTTSRFYRAIANIPAPQPCRRCDRDGGTRAIR